ncbi:MAG: Dyp-type peroxidase family [Solirubrobacterales bacterium]|nr:Dyp-type peroxidase family [Solirubrobacterales bacterium]
MAANTEVAAGEGETAAPGMDLADIQGNLLRGYGFAHARHFALGVTDAKRAKAFLAGLVSGDETQSPQISTEQHWRPNVRPHYRLNLGLTFAGLKALGVREGALKDFPAAFQEGPAARALKVDLDFPEGVGLGDQKEERSGPKNWILGNPAQPDVHMLLSLYTNEHQKGPLERFSKLLRKLFGDAKLTEMLAFDADALPERRVHFGYRDGIAQPRIQGAPGRARPDMQPECEPGDFLLGCGYKNVYGGNYLGSLPPALADNGTYAAFRILEQDVAAFEDLLVDWSKRYKLGSPEFVAAKLMGRWRHGAPLTLSPDPKSPDPKLAEHEINNFDYAPAEGHTTFFDDAHGRRCPIGAHIRRLNPRSSLVMGRPHSRRLIRRGMPYGPPFEKGDGKERGLVGMFICGDLELQYEFILRVWANMDLATHGLRGTREPILGCQPEDGGEFVLRTSDARDPIVMINLPRLVQTRGSVYCFVPGIGGLRQLAGIAGPPGGSAAKP